MVGPLGFLLCGGAKRRSPIGGSAKGTPRNWRTSGADWLKKPWMGPLEVWTRRPALVELLLDDASTPKTCRVSRRESRLCGKNLILWAMIDQTDPGEKA